VHTNNTNKNPEKANNKYENSNEKPWKPRSKA
jgi:hypothetical protein